mmetsp:Transcript_14954/g.27773  ORF Transcript_14954/g.27773 Transcript_14954/m.27773 type:complete len:110 (+) Transcript_14954:2216-2545(+)
MSSSWLPVSIITLPLVTEVPSGFPRTTMTSAFLTVVKRCAMTMVVRLASFSSMSLSRAFCTICSEMLSRAEVASSRTRIGGFLRRARAMATRCFSPPLSFPPLGPTVVL